MYLSRLILNPLSRRVQKEMANPYEMHRSIMRAFPARIGDDSERVLFRVDQQPRPALGRHRPARPDPCSPAG